LAKDRREGEVWYHHPDTTRCVVDFTITEPVSWAYGGFSVEAQLANRGLIARARDVAAFMEAYEVRGNPARDNIEWLHYGGMPGTFTMAYCRKDNVKIVALFNQRGGGNDPALRDEDIKPALDKAVNDLLAK